MRRLLAFLPMLFLVATLVAQVNCQISNLTVTWLPGPAPCQYFAVLNFEHTGTTNQFTVQGNGQNYGTFPYNLLPLPIGPFTAGAQIDTLEFVVSDAVVQGCQSFVVAALPACNAGGTDCAITNVQVQTGDCLPNAPAFQLWLNFEVQNPTNDFFELWTSGGQYLGIFPLGLLPLQVPAFPWNGGPVQELKICLNDNPDCCTVVEFPTPPCLNPMPPCTISDLKATVGDCTSDSTFAVTLSFDVFDPTQVDSFFVTANGQSLGAFGFNQLPLTFDSLDWNGLLFTHMSVCAGNLPGCCREIQLVAPDCLPFDTCEVLNIFVDPISCTSDSTYKLRVNFQATNPGQDSFAVYANGALLGNFPNTAAPLTIDSFPWSGNNFDVLKICVQQDSTSAPCCRTREFLAPGCLTAPDDSCGVFNLVVDTGDCNADSTYNLWVNFQVLQPDQYLQFQAYANGVLIGTYNLDSLPLHIEHFPWNGGQNDVIKICLIDNNAIACCETLEFAVPDCLSGGPCEVFGFQVETGDCHPDDSTYVLVVNFQVQNPPSQTFILYANGQVFGTYNLSQLPLTIPNFPYDGGQNDVVKVCFSNNIGAIGCCRTLEFPVPDCITQGPCEIFDLVVDTGDCTTDSTYSIWINFQVQNPASGQFALWANGVFFGTYNLNQLPLNIQNFPWNGGPNDYLKVCIVTPGTTSACCRTIEYPVPGCLGGGGNDCHIYDLQVIHTPCLCGQFFAVLTFEHDNGGPAGFDIVGNGNNYGNYSYDHPQPIILGPFDGDGVTQYEFVVKDHLNGDCRDEFVLGEVDCTSPTNEPNGQAGQMVLSPNPASNQLNVNATLPGLSNLGEATVEVYHADGRRVRSFTVPEGGNFRMDVFDLPAGIYRLSVQTAAGRVEGSFAKQ